jgi:prepilin-type N-terminal cleavage/methylation domain-containing protein
VTTAREPAVMSSPGRDTAAGFTLLEVLVTIGLIALVSTLVVNNLGAFVPKARLDASASLLVRNVDLLRSEARIQSRRYVLQLDLKNSRWRRVTPAERLLTLDDSQLSVDPEYEDWSEFERGVRLAGAGDPVDGMVRDGLYELAFDENGQTADQIVVFALAEDPKMIWTVQIRGLTGQCEVIENFDGKEQPLQEIGEGMF